MANDIRAYGPSAIAHRQICALHDNDRMTMCSGTLRRGGPCVNKAMGRPEPRMMPTCKIHRDQLKILGQCRAILPCGFECGGLFEWKPHGFQLCANHREYPMPCYFFSIPIEMRLRVYRFLLPDRPIPPRFRAPRNLRADGERVCTAIFRVNYQTHNEAANLLYGTGVFTIELSEHSLTMCNLPKNYMRFDSLHQGNTALQDYQMQLMLLEQQNRRRLMIARQDQDNLSGGSSSRPNMPPIPFACRSIEPIWDPPLNERYFCMIRFFIVEFVFRSLGRSNAHPRPRGSVNGDAENRLSLESMRYEYCDHAHKLIGRLQFIQTPIARLEVIFKFSDTCGKREEAFSAAQFLLRPFRRLCHVTKSEVLSITVNNVQDHETELLVPGWVSCVENRTFADYLEIWSKELSNSKPSFKLTEVFEAYWKLEKLLYSMKAHCHHAEPKFTQFASLLHVARVARESNNLTSFREVWERVVNVWFEYLNDQKEFQSDMARSIDAIYGIVEKGS